MMGEDRGKRQGNEGEDQEAVDKGDGGDGQGLACGGDVGGRDNDRVRR